MGAPDKYLQPGTQLAKTYEIIEHIAEGGMGVVYSARHLRLDSLLVAVKVLSTDVGLDQNEVNKRFRLEAEICSSFKHPNIVSVMDWGEINGQPFFVMEYLEGRTLRQYLRTRAKVSLQQVVRIVKEIGAGLSAAHKRGVVHRDIKPSNIFLCGLDQSTGAFDYIKIIDFGISRVANNNFITTKSNNFVGTPRYMAPEQIKGKGPKIDGRADQFALATIAYELLAGIVPFTAKTVDTLFYQVLFEPAKPIRDHVPELPDYVSASLDKALAKKREDRFIDIETFVASFSGEMPMPAEMATAVEGRPQLPDRQLDPGEDTLDQTELMQKRPGAVLEPVKASSQKFKGLAWGAGGFALLGIVLGLSYTQFFAQGFGATAAVQAPIVDAGQGDINGGDVGVRAVDAAIDASSLDTEPKTVDATIIPRHRHKTKKAAPLTLNPTPLSSAARRFLQQASSAYEKRDYKTCVRRAMQSVGLQDSIAARALLTKSYCALGDLSNAKAHFYYLRARQKKSAKKACKDLGITLY